MRILGRYFSVFRNVFQFESVTPKVLQTSYYADMSFILYIYLMYANHILTSTRRLFVIVVKLY